MYEVEIKIELSPEEKEVFIAQLVKKGFVYKGLTPQNDYYIEAKASPYKGYDLKRYRNEDGTFIYTEKIWGVIDGQPFRKEDEHEVTKEEFDSAVLTYPNALKIIKDREWYAGSYLGKDISLTIDSVTFDHSTGTRYFTEAEIQVADKDEVIQTKNLLKEFLKEALQKSELTEAPEMFTMAFEQK